MAQADGGVERRHPRAARSPRRTWIGKMFEGGHEAVKHAIGEYVRVKSPRDCTVHNIDGSMSLPPSLKATADKSLMRATCASIRARRKAKDAPEGRDERRQIAKAVGERNR